MTKKEFRQFQHLPAEREAAIRKIERLERQAELVPIVHDKAKASQQEFPYTLMHVDIEAPEPVRYTSIQREIIRTRRALKDIERRCDKLERMISKIEDSRTRQIITVRYLDGKSLKDTAIQFDLTEQHVGRIIKDAIKNF